MAPVYESRDKVKSGVPFGGIGAGKFEITPSGLFNAFTFQNNWSAPLEGSGEYPGILGYHFGLSAWDGRGDALSRRAVLLQTVPVLKIPTVRRIRYEGYFPKATLYFEDPALGLDASLEVFSPWIPQDAMYSSLPCVFFKLNLKNTRKTPVRAGFLFIGRNTIGEWCVGRRNRIVDERKSIHLEFLSEDTAAADGRLGVIRFSFVKGDWQTSFIESWNAVTRNFSFTPQDISLLAWDAFAARGVLPNLRDAKVVPGENRELCGAVAAGTRLKPNEEKHFLFTANWYFPRHALGHRYQKWFKNAGAVSAYALRHRNRLERRVDRVRQAVFSLPFPPWFNDALLTNLAPFFAASWYTRDGRFAFYEAPVICPLMGTLDVGFYGSIPLSYFYPELSLSLMAQFAVAQRADGYIPHDLGRQRLGWPSDGTTFYFWKDLNPKFILMVYRDSLWAGRKGLFKRFYPNVKKALAWSMRADRDGDGLPEDEGADQTFDLWEFFGANAYTAGLHLASLLAAERMGRLLGDHDFVRECHSGFMKGSRSFEAKLWNGKYFGKTCMVSQLNGQWYADLLGLGSIADDNKIKKALASTLRLNGGASPFGLVNSVRPDGRVDTANDHSRNIWAGMNYAFLALCLSRGFPLNEVLKQARKIWDNVVQIQKSPWNQADTVDSKTGRYVFGDFYYRNMAIWSLPIIFAKRSKKTAAVLKYLRSLP